jgi:Flp pilus assembly protein CpaB
MRSPTATAPLTRYRRPISALLAATATALALLAARPTPPPTAQVLAAARDLPTGTTLRLKDIQILSLPPPAVPTGALRPARPHSALPVSDPAPPPAQPLTAGPPAASRRTSAWPRSIRPTSARPTSAWQPCTRPTSARPTTAQPPCTRPTTARPPFAWPPSARASVFVQHVLTHRLRHDRHGHADPDQTRHGGGVGDQPARDGNAGDSTHDRLPSPPSSQPTNGSPPPQRGGGHRSVHQAFDRANLAVHHTRPGQSHSCGSPDSSRITRPDTLAQRRTRPPSARPPTARPPNARPPNARPPNARPRLTWQRPTWQRPGTAGRAAGKGNWRLASGSSPRSPAVGRVLAGPMRRGEVLTDVRLVGGGLLEGYGPGIVATPVRVADGGTVRLVRPGDQVDVLAAGVTEADPATELIPGMEAGPKQTTQARLIVSAVHVIAVPRESAETRAAGGLIVLATNRLQAAALVGATGTRLHLTIVDDRGG